MNQVKLSTKGIVQSLLKKIHQEHTHTQIDKLTTSRNPPKGYIAKKDMFTTQGSHQRDINITTLSKQPKDTKRNSPLIWKSTKWIRVTEEIFFQNLKANCIQISIHTAQIHTQAGVYLGLGLKQPSK